MPLNLEIQTYTEKDCKNLFLEDMTGDYVAGSNPGGYGGPNLDSSLVESVVVTVNYTALEVSNVFTFSLMSNTIVLAEMSFGGGAPIDITAILPDTSWPFTSVNPFNLTTSVWSDILPQFDDMVYEVTYRVISTTGPVDVETQSTMLIDCATCCCVTKKSVKIDINNPDALVTALIPTAYLQTAQYANSLGLTAKANLYLQKAKDICDQQDCGCNC